MKGKKIYLTLFSFLIVFISGLLLAPHVNAEGNELEEQHIHATVHEDGSATITEERIANISEGTEMFIVIGNLGKSEIKDFTVEENDEQFTYVDDWNIDASLEEKKKKNGIVKNGAEYELIWGVGDYGDHTYIVEYTITDFVKQLEDDQMIFWRFVNDQTNVPPEKVTIEIETDNGFDRDTEKIWAFGFEGDIHFLGDRIYAKNDESLTDSNYVTVLVQLPDGNFQTNDKLNKTFAEVKEEASEGSDYKDSGKNLADKIVTIVSSSAVVVVFIVIFYFIIKGIIRRIKQLSLKKSTKGEYYRDIPYEGDITLPYHILKNMHEANFSQIFAAYLLKWIYDGRIDIKTVEKKFIFTKKEQVIQILEVNFPKVDEFEVDFFDLILAASGGKEQLSQKDFGKHLKDHVKKIEELEEEMEEHSKEELEDGGYIKPKLNQSFFSSKTQYTNTEKGTSFEEDIYKFQNYLKDFSLIEEQEAANVHLWDSYMIWAAILGITEEVYKQFKIVDPTYVERTAFSYNHIVFSNMYAKEVASTSPAAGGGGAASVGGGGGSFGGGSGGGVR